MCVEVRGQVARVFFFHHVPETRPWVVRLDRLSHLASPDAPESCIFPSPFPLSFSGATKFNVLQTPLSSSICKVLVVDP